MIMKTIKLGLIIAIAASTFVSCKKNGGFCFKGNGDIVTEERDLSDFTQISLSTSADVYYTQADEYSVKVEASQNLMEIIETKVEGSKLKIKRKKGTCLRGNNPIRIYVNSPDIETIFNFRKRRYRVEKFNRY